MMSEIHLGKMYKLTDKSDPYIVTYIVPTDWARRDKRKFRFLIVGRAERSYAFGVSRLHQLYEVEEIQNEW